MDYLFRAVHLKVPASVTSAFSRIVLEVKPYQGGNIDSESELKIVSSIAIPRTYVQKVDAWEVNMW